jgi:hypothetical protein
VIAVLADAVDPQVECLLLAADTGDLGGAADERGVALAVHSPNADYAKGSVELHDAWSNKVA